MVLAYFGVSVTEDYLVQLLDTDPVGGTELKQIVRVEPLGFQVDVRRATLGELAALSLRRVPVIVPVYTAHLPTHPLPPWGAHTVVVAGVTASQVVIFDPLRDH